MLKSPSYEVIPNRCKCHPETCCCNDWAVYYNDGKDIYFDLRKENKHSTHFRKDVAELVARALNTELASAN